MARSVTTLLRRKTPRGGALEKRVAAPHRDRVVKNPVAWYTPRFWHGMRLGTWLRELATNRFDISPSQAPMSVSVTCFSAANSMLAVMDQALYGRKVAKVELAEPPLFILGHWRSGTTFLHELLICDPAHTYATTYQCFAPHHFLASDELVPWATRFLLPSRRPMDNMAAGWDRPQEDEFALQNLGMPSPYLSMMFPNHGPVHCDYLTLRNLAAEDRRKWQETLATFFKRIALRDNRRIVVKSPPHTARVKALLEIFPNAKFVHLARDPYALYASTVALWRSLNEVQAAHVVRDESWIGPYVVDSLRRMYGAYFEDRKLLAANQLVELRYEDLIDDPQRQVREIYERLELGDFARIQPALASHLSDVKNYRTNRHELDDSTRDEIHTAWLEYFEQFEYA